MKAFSPKLLISIGVSLLILGVIYWKIDIINIKDALVQVDVPVFIGALLILIPTTLLSALRFSMLLSGENKPTLSLATKLILAGSTMNVILKIALRRASIKMFVILSTKSLSLMTEAQTGQIKS